MLSLEEEEASAPLTRGKAGEETKCAIPTIGTESYKLPGLEQMT